MTFAYIVKKIAQAWLASMAKSHLAESLVVQESLSIQTAKQTHLLCNECNTEPKG